MTSDLSAPRLNFVETGSGADFVFQHGLCGDASQPAEIFPRDLPYRLLTLESRGHGRSEAGDVAAFSLVTFADDVAAMIESRANPPVVLGGISMGAAIALRLAVRRPDLVRALVLARPAWITKAAPANMRPYAEVGKLLSTYAAKEARDRFDRSETAAWLARKGPDNLASLRSFFGREPVAVTAALLTRIPVDGPGVTATEVGQLHVPVLTIGQARDPLHPLAHAERLAAMISGSRLEEVTAKAEDRARHTADCRSALHRFLMTVPDRGTLSAV